MRNLAMSRFRLATLRLPIHQSRPSSSSTRWKTRQTNDTYTRDAKVSGLKSRAAFKLLELDAKHRLFKPGDTVIDLGYAPGSWSQVAVSKTAPGGRVVGIDMIPAQPPRGASAIQGDFLSPHTREEVRLYVQDPDLGRSRRRTSGILDAQINTSTPEDAGRVVDVVLSDMSAPWPLTTGSWVKSVSNPYFRMLNTTGVAFKDHAGSMVRDPGVNMADGQDLCMAALTFSYDTLKTGGHFLCKFYQGAEDKALELKLRALFERVHREKPASSRKVRHQVMYSLTIQESKESYFLALRRRPDVDRAVIDLPLDLAG